MKKLLKQDTIDYCVSGHGFDSAMTFNEMIQFYRSRGFREEVPVGINRSRFFADDLAVIV